MCGCCFKRIVCFQAVRFLCEFFEKNFQSYHLSVDCVKINDKGFFFGNPPLFGAGAAFKIVDEFTEYSEKGFSSVNL